MPNQAKNWIAVNINILPTVRQVFLPDRYKVIWPGWNMFFKLLKEIETIKKHLLGTICQSKPLCLFVRELGKERTFHQLPSKFFKKITKMLISHRNICRTLCIKCII